MERKACVLKHCLLKFSGSILQFYLFFGISKMVSKMVITVLLVG
jgi:hypothetical protein